jgi:hypothetical protein
MYDGVFGGSSMGNFNICHHSSKTTACTYQVNEIRQSSIPITFVPLTRPFIHVALF